MSGAGALLGLIFGAGAVLAIAGLLALRPARLADRLVRGGSPAPHAQGPLGALIDMLLGYGVFILWLFLRVWLLDAGILTEATDRIATVSSLVVSFLVLPLTVEMLTKGRSLGKLAVGGRIVRLDGGAASTSAPVRFSNSAK